MALDEPRNDEQPIQVNGIGVLIGDEEKALVEGATVDYVKDGYREGFTIGSADDSCS
jgi:Fe-S cluster assembly iron-binding protein IscA